MHFLQMPVEILEKIFKDTENLVNLSKTCCHFDELISNSPALMDKIELKLNKCYEYWERADYKEFKDLTKALLASQKPFRRVSIDNEYHPKYLKILKKNSTTIHSLAIFSYEGEQVMTRDDLIDVLKVLANSLTTLILDGYCSVERWCFNDDDFEVAVEMPKLKSLTLYTMSYEFLQLFMKCKVTKFHIISRVSMYFTRRNIQYLVNFLSVQVDLKILRSNSDVLMNGILSNEDSRHDYVYFPEEENEKVTDADVVDNFKFNLEELSIGKRNRDYSDVTKVHQFLRKQTNLKTFRGGMKSCSMCVLLNELPNLKYVDLRTDEDELRISRLNRNITELSTNRVDLLRFLPNVKILTVAGDTQLVHLSKMLSPESYPQLKTLKISLEEYLRPKQVSVKIESIKNVDILEYNEDSTNKTWLPFIASNDQIEKLVLTCKIGPDELTTILKTCKNLQSLDFADAISGDIKNLAEVINEFGNELKYLKIPNREELIEDCKNIQSTKLKIYY